MAKTRFSPTRKTLEYLRDHGYPCAVTEKWVKIGKFGIRRDCFCGDLIALAGDATINIQAGVGSMHAAKIAKAASLPELKQWLSSPYRWFQVWTWSKKMQVKKNGSKSKKGVWVPRVSSLKLVDGEIQVCDFKLK